MCSGSEALSIGLIGSRGDRRDSSFTDTERRETGDDSFSCDRPMLSFCFMLSPWRSAGDWNLKVLCNNPNSVGNESRDLIKLLTDYLRKRYLYLATKQPTAPTLSNKPSDTW